MSAPPVKRPRGRPSRSREDDGLEAAMRTFWIRGFDATTVDDLCRVMNMPRATLYSLFGNKESLFLAAITHYAETRIAAVTGSLGPKGTLAEDLEAFFASVVSLATSDKQARGCLISCVLADAAGDRPAFRTELDRRLTALEQRIETRLLQAAWAHEGGCQPSAAAGMAAAVARGIMVNSRAGKSREALQPVARAAVAALVQLSAS